MGWARPRAALRRSLCAEAAPPPRDPAFESHRLQMPVSGTAKRSPCQTCSVAYTSTARPQIPVQDFCGILFSCQFSCSCIHQLHNIIAKRPRALRLGPERKLRRIERNSDESSETPTNRAKLRRIERSSDGAVSSPPRTTSHGENRSQGPPSRSRALAADACEHASHRRCSS